MYGAVTVNSQSVLAVTDGEGECVHRVAKGGALVRSLGKGVLGGGLLFGASFDLKGNVWVTDYDNNKVVKLSQDGRLLQTIHHASSESDCFSRPRGVFVSAESLIYICDEGNNRVTIHDIEGKFLFAFGSEGSGPGCFHGPTDVTFGSDGLVYIVDQGNMRVCVWSKEGTSKRDFKIIHTPTYIAATSDNHLLIISHKSHTIMVYTLEGELVHYFDVSGTDPGRFSCPCGVCVDDSGLVYVADNVEPTYPGLLN